MPQDRKSGQKANLYGHETSRRIADKIGAISISDDSNEFLFEGRLVTIRCAKTGNNQVGVTYAMLDRVDLVIAAFEKEKNLYELFEITPALYSQFMRDSKDEGHVGLVTKKIMHEHGKMFRAVQI